MHNNASHNALAPNYYHPLSLIYMMLIDSKMWGACAVFCCFVQLFVRSSFEGLLFWERTFMLACWIWVHWISVGMRKESNFQNFRLNVIYLESVCSAPNSGMSFWEYFWCFNCWKFMEKTNANYRGMYIDLNWERFGHFCELHFGCCKRYEKLNKKTQQLRYIFLSRYSNFGFFFFFV